MLKLLPLDRRLYLPGDFDKFHHRHIIFGKKIDFFFQQVIIYINNLPPCSWAGHVEALFNFFNVFKLNDLFRLPVGDKNKSSVIGNVERSHVNHIHAIEHQ